METQAKSSAREEEVPGARRVHRSDEHLGPVGLIVP
jgi:hypothetical protein